MELTEHMIAARLGVSDMLQVKRLNLYNYGFDSIALIGEMKNLQVLNITGNKIKSLEAVKECKQLTELLARRNEIESLRELHVLKDLPLLERLSIDENPFADLLSENYRNTIIGLLPNLKTLDDIQITDMERENVQKSMASGDQKRTTNTATSSVESLVSLENANNNNINSRSSSISSEDANSLADDDDMKLVDSEGSEHFESPRNSLTCDEVTVLVQANATASPAISKGTHVNLHLTLPLPSPVNENEASTSQQTNSDCNCEDCSRIRCLATRCDNLKRKMLEEFESIYRQKNQSFLLTKTSILVDIIAMLVDDLDLPQLREIEGIVRRRIIQKFN